LTIDERLEAIAMHLEVLTRVHEDFEKKSDKRHEEFVRQMTSYSADVKDAIARLANIARTTNDSTTATTTSATSRIK
jgi:hypothetical protein